MARSAPHFFKVFLPDLLSQHLEIPPAFRKHLENESPGMVSLKGPGGSIWNAELVENSQGFRLESGWKEFVADHSLAAGDFLVFQYDGRLRFSVLVFDSTACDKEAAFSARRPQCDVIVTIESSTEEQEKEEEGETVLEDTQAADSSQNDSLGVNSKKRIGVSDSFKNLPPLKKNCNTLSRSASKGSVDCFAPYSQTSTPHSSSKKQVNFNEMDSSETTIKSSKSLKLINYGHVRRRGEAVAKVQKMPSLISQRRPVTQEEVDRALERAKLFKSKNPSTLIVMQDSYVYSSFFMNMPRHFAREHLPKINRKITLWDPQGNPWEISFVCYNTHCSLSGGWGAFSFANNLEKYDVCVFELVRKNNLKVHIFRVVESIAPLIRRSQLRD
ncbi:B3 domain-containing protein Os11g0197600-like isoform X3 [Ananas comosus]|uniref:B3 domain-containing protein Os11g0197600-like isoform X3 n=1 Tax=Ananas comosus TaxID=4615 RepID=A0A6P5GCF3_ANACO|nr:B3 domain-containing protein Os11g0197600-like isoform X3 [Ananas comosus]